MSKKKPPSERRQKLSELPIPPDATASGGVELLRAWLVKHSSRPQHALQIAINFSWDVPDQPLQRAWGMMLADLIRHVALHLQQEYGIDVSSSVAALKHNLLRELDSPTTGHTLVSKAEADRLAAEERGDQ
jgi:hypothetical protein